MTPGKYDLNLYRGDTYAWAFALWHDVDKTDPVDLSAATVAAQIRNKAGGDTIMDMSVEVEAVAPYNTITARIEAETWDTAPGLGSGAWDLQVTYANGDVQTVLAGKVKVTADVTRVTAPALFSVVPNGNVA